MRTVGVRNSPRASGRAAAQRQSPHSIHNDLGKISRPPSYARANEHERMPRDEKAVAGDPALNPSEESDVRNLVVNELLFGIGEPKSQLYVVETGALAVYEPRWNGHRAVIEFAFPGDLVGLGLSEYACMQRQGHDRDARALLAPERAGPANLQTIPGPNPGWPMPSNARSNFSESPLLGSVGKIHLDALPPSCSRYRVKTSRRDATRLCWHSH